MTMNVSKREAYFLGIITEEFFGVAEVVFIDSQARNETTALVGVSSRWSAVVAVIRESATVGSRKSLSLRGLTRWWE